MVRPSITTLPVVSAWVKSNKAGGSLTEEQLATAYNAAEAFVGKRVRWWTADEIDQEEGYPPAPDDLVLAVCLQTMRLLARRNSPEGVIGVQDLGAAYVPGTDRDVERLMAPYRPVGFA